MSLNQAFLKLYGDKPDAPPVTNDRPDDEEPVSRPALQDGTADEVNISLRVDRGGTPVSRRFAAMREDRQRNIFSIEEERRRRNPPDLTHRSRRRPSRVSQWKNTGPMHGISWKFRRWGLRI